MEKANHKLPVEVQEFLKAEAERKGILVSVHIVELLTSYYQVRRKPVDIVPTGSLHN